MTAQPLANTRSRSTAPHSDDAQATMLWLLQQTRIVHDLDVVIAGKTFTFKYRKLAYEETIRVAGEAVEIPDMDPRTPRNATPPQPRYRDDLYFRACVKAMFMQEDLVSEQPFPLTDQVIRAFPPEVGVQFAVLLPNIDARQMLAEAEELKKAPAACLSQEDLSSPPTTTS